jgi:hypothetical protein
MERLRNEDRRSCTKRTLLLRAFPAFLAFLVFVLPMAEVAIAAAAAVVEMGLSNREDKALRAERHTS